MSSRVVDGCIKCGACLQACPVLAQEGRDSFPGPRRLAVEAPRFDAPFQELQAPLSTCTTCGRCEEACPSRLPLPAALVRVRALSYKGAQRPEGQARMLENIAATGRTVIPPSAGEEAPAVGDLALFPGCIAEGRLPGSVTAAMLVLRASGSRPYVPAGWACCGSPLDKIGAADQLSTVMKVNEARLGSDRIVTTCPGCTVQLRTALGRDTWHIIEHLHATGLPAGVFDPQAPPVKVALHHPCHLARVVGPHTMEMARELLEAVPGVAVVSHPGEDACCGGGGGVASSRPEVAEEMARRKVRLARRAGAEVMIAPCPFCVVNLRRAGGIPVEELTTFLASRLHPGQNK